VSSSEGRRRLVARGAVANGLGFAVLLVALVASERLDAARATIATVEGAPTGVTEDERATAAPAILPGAWVIVAVVGGVLAWVFAKRFLAMFERDTAAWRAARILAYVAVVAWVLWQLWGAWIVGDEGAPRARSVVGWLAALALAGAVVCSGVVRDTKEAWERAAVVRVQLVFLLALFFIVFAAPFTSDQLTDVLRAWGDDGISRPVAGIAAALLLGAACRASATRLLVPECRGRSWLERGLWRLRGAAAALVIVAVVLGIAGVWAAGFLAIAVAAFLVLTRTAETPLVARGTVGPVDRTERTRLRRLASALGVVPLAILLVGLVSALVDSLLLLRAWPSSTVWELLAWTVIVALLLAAVAARTYAPGGLSWTTLEDRLPRPVLLAAAMIAGGLAWPSPPLSAFLLLMLGVAAALKVFGDRRAPELWLTSGAVGGVAIAVFADPVDATVGLGAFGLALIGFGAWLCLLHLAGSAGARRETVFTVWGAHRPAPVVTVLALWVLVAFLAAPQHVHDVRTIADGGRDPVSVEEAVGTWLTAQPPTAEGDYLPMLIVAASGGGSKAAYWTDLVLDCVFGEGEPDRNAGDECGHSPQAGQRFGRLFLTSSVSGGSIGIYHLLNHRHEIGRGRAWIDETAGHEILSPIVGWGLFHDLPAFMAGLPIDAGTCDERLRCRVNADRALVQEGAIHGLALRGQLATDAGVMEITLPVAVFNGTAGWGPGRVLVSRLALAPPQDVGCSIDGRQPIAGAVDAHDVLRDDRDVPILTAALLSARFPALEPAGRLGDRDDPPKFADCSPPPVQRAATIRDGGVVENTGLLTITELLPSIRRGIEAWKEKTGSGNLDVRPIVVSIDDDVLGVLGDNDYKRETLGLGTSGNRSTRARDRLKRCEFADVTYRRISPSPHVGAQAATGWEISRTSRREDLGETLRARTREGAGRDPIQELRDMLDGRVRPACRR
jgi:hypothetical protein